MSPIFKKTSCVIVQKNQRESETPRPRFKCLHNGIVLIVNCFKLLQKYAVFCKKQICDGKDCSVIRKWRHVWGDYIIFMDYFESCLGIMSLL